MRRISLFFFTLVLVAGLGFSAFALEQELAGIWAGSLDLGGAELKLIFHISQAADGSYSGLLDVPAQGAKGIPLSFAGEKGGKLVFDVPLIAGAFKGNFQGVELAGVWEQSGLKLPLNLKRQKAGEVPGFNRPQEPKPPFPYKVEEVSYPNRGAGIELAGTLTKPFGAGPFPVALLISGSGPQDRNEEIAGHKPFLVLADYLTKQGIAVLRVDDRGVGESGGDFASGTSLDFASDVIAGVEYLKGREDINSSQIGLIGHSEGGIIGPLVASKRDDIAFLVLLAAPGLTGEEISLLQSEKIQRAAGVPEQILTRELALLGEILQINKEVEDIAMAAEQIANAILARLAELSPAEREAVGDLDLLIQTQLSQVLSPWFRFFQTYDPIPALTKVTCPVLAINGTKDLQVPAEENLAKIGAALEKGGNENYTIVELPGLNHLFQTTETGLPDEYVLLEETFSPLALETIGRWLWEILGEK